MYFGIFKELVFYCIKNGGRCERLRKKTVNGNGWMTRSCFKVEEASTLWECKCWRNGARRSEACSSD